MELPFTGGAYTSYSTNVNAQRCVNLFPAIEKQDAKNPVVLYGTAGLVEFSDLATEGAFTIARGAWEFGDVLYVVLGPDVYSVTSAGVRTNIGSITTSTGNVFLADNGTEVIIVDGSAFGYLITAGVLAVIADADFPVASSVTFQDGYFIITKTDTGQIWISGLYDGTDWDALDFDTAEASPDNAKVVISNSHDLWIFGGKTAEIYYNSGNADFPFTRIPGGLVELGIEAAASALKINGIIYWLSTEKRVVRTRGYQFDTVSTPQIDYYISTYTTTSDARAFSYQALGHIFYVLTFPTEDKTWVYDVTTEIWHEWQSYVSSSGVVAGWGKHRANCIVKFGDDYIAGDYENGKLYTIDIDTYTDYTEDVRRIRASQVINKDRFYVIWHSLEIEFESGAGLISGYGSNPTAVLQWSDDGGHTWSNEHSTYIGDIGEYKNRARWRRMGKSRNRVLKVTVSDPIKVVILGAYAELEECVA